MGAALVLLLVALGAMAAGVLIGRYYVPDDRQLRRTARHSRAYMRALSHLIARDHDTAVTELRAIVEENIDDTEPYFALGALFRSRGEHERAIRVHQALAVRERDKRKLRQRAMYELGLDFRAAGMPRRATRAMEEVLLEDPSHEGALRVLAALYEEQARFNEAAGLWQRLGRRRGEDHSHREHHLLVAAAQAALGRDDPDSAKQLLKAAQKHEESAHFYAAAAELAAARGNHRGAKERLTQALVADPGLAPHLLPGLIAAEQGLAGPSDAARQSQDDLDDEAEDRAAELPAASSPPQLTAGTDVQPAAGSTALPPLITPHSHSGVLPRPAEPGSSITPHSHSGVLPRPAEPGSSITPHSHSGVLPRPAEPGSSITPHSHSGVLPRPAEPGSSITPHSHSGVLPRPAEPGSSITPHSHSGVLPRPAEPGSSITPHSHSGVLPRPAEPGSSTVVAPGAASGAALATSPPAQTAAPAPDASAPHAAEALLPASPSVSTVLASSGGSLVPSGRREPTTAPAADSRGDGAAMPALSGRATPSIVAVAGVAVAGEHAAAPSRGVAEQVLALLAEVEAQTGPRLEIALIRAQLTPPGDAAGRAALARELTARFPESLAARVATARLALASDDRAALRGALDALVSDSGMLAWALRGRWQCAHCGNRPGAFSWRCGQCRRWNTLRMETGIDPPPAPPRERRAAPRVTRPDALLGASPDESLPAPTIDPGLSASELASAGVRRSLLGRVGGWVSGVWRRDAS